MRRVLSLLVDMEALLPAKVATVHLEDMELLLPVKAAMVPLAAMEVSLKAVLEDMVDPLLLVKVATLLNSKAVTLAAASKATVLLPHHLDTSSVYVLNDTPKIART